MSIQISNNITIGPDIDITKLIGYPVQLKTGFLSFDYTCRSQFPYLTLILGEKEHVHAFLNTIQYNFAKQRRLRHQHLNSYGTSWGTVRDATNQFIDYKSNLNTITHARYTSDVVPAQGMELIDFRKILIDNNGIGFVSKSNTSYSDIALADLAINISKPDADQISRVSALKCRNPGGFSAFNIGYRNGNCYET